MNMLTNLSLQIFSIRSDWLKVYVPDIDHVKDVHGKKKQSAPGAPFPYWAQIWPAALGLCDFLADHLPYIQDKKIVELGAGLARPISEVLFFASKFTVLKLPLFSIGIGSISNAGIAKLLVSQLVADGKK